MGKAGVLPALALLSGLIGVAQAQDAPMSAIGWLSDSLTAPQTTVGTVAGEAPVDGGATVSPVTVKPLGTDDGPKPDAIGLLPPALTGLPASLWSGSTAPDVAWLIREEQADMLPAAQALLIKLLLAEADPPEPDGTSGDAVFLARVDKLLEMGALDQAHALLERAGPASVDVTRRWFDTALLIGQEDDVCRAMEEKPDLSPTYPTRIFCMARAGDWDGAVILLGTARPLDVINEEEDALLARFLDPDLFEGEPPLDPPRPITPLTFRLFEAIGQAIPTRGLPLAFAQADLRSNNGWKAQVEAAERLARTGAVTDNQLLGLYTQQKPAASGGVWDRVSAVQALESALKEEDGDTLETLLPRLWTQLTKAQTEVPIARVHGPALAAFPLDGPAARIALHMGLLSDAYEDVAQRAVPTTDLDRFLVALAQGTLAGVTAPDSATRAVADGFSQAPLPTDIAALLEENRLGEAILKALDRLASGLAGDLDDLANALAVLRRVGLETTARRVALEFLILERRA
ncbi:MAG TPA: hypothetical protein DEO85_10000 [Maritimibacter sp.]|nr:hypothetical protein [Maritimibacter sp.]